MCCKTPTKWQKLIRREGQYPSGASEFAWPLAKYNTDNQCPIGAFFGRGPDWRRMRNFIQTDLLHPTAATRYAPGILLGARASSRGITEYADNMNAYINLAAFEMFSTAMLGQQPGILDPTVETNPRDVEFCNIVAQSLASHSQLMHSAKDAVLCNVLWLQD